MSMEKASISCIPDNVVEGVLMSDNVSTEDMDDTISKLGMVLIFIGITLAVIVTRIMIGGV